MKLRSNPALNVYLVTFLAFGWLLAVDPSAASANSPDPESQLSTYNANLSTYNSTLASYTSHYNTYDPANVSDLDTASAAIANFSSAVSSFSSDVSTYTSALAAYTSAQSSVDNYDANVSASAEAVSTSEQALSNAQTASAEATAAREALEADKTSLTATRDEKESAYQATVNSTNYSELETFDSASITTNLQFLINGTTAITTTPNSDIYLTNVESEYSGTYVSGGAIKLYLTSTPLQMKTDNTGATTFSYATGALNGSFNASVVFTDGSTGTFNVPNGVSSETSSDNYSYQATYTAPEGKFIQSVTFAHYDWYYLDNIGFSGASTTYDETAYNEYLSAQAALDAYLTNTYSPAVTAETNAQTAASTAQTTYDSAVGTYNTLTAEGYYDSLVVAASDAQSTSDTAHTQTQTHISNLETLKTAAADALSAVVLPPTSIAVTSLDDTEDEGTLRWAIAQANATSGGKYDAITFDVSGTINLSSNLPNITQTLSIDSDDLVTLSGNYQIYVSNGVTFVVNDMNFNQTYITNERGTLYVNGSTFTNLQSYGVGNKNGATLTYIDGTVFNGGTRAVFSDWGNTPSQFTTDDASYQNRIYITNSTFQNLSTAIGTERSVFVSDSTFTNNTVHINARGINKYRIVDNTFTGGVRAIQTFANIPGWAGFFDNASVTANNRYIAGNDFSGQSQGAIYLDDYYDSTANQSGATIRDNTWDESGSYWVSWADSETRTQETVLDGNMYPYYSLNNTSSLKELYAPTSVSAVVNEDSSVTVTWEPVPGYNVQTERYAIFFKTPDTNGWAVSSYETTITLSPELFENTGGFDETYEIRLRADNDTDGVYSAFAEPVTVVVADPNPPAPEPEPAPAPAPAPQPAPAPAPAPAPEPEPEPQPEEKPIKEEEPKEEEPKEEEPLEEETPKEEPKEEEQPTPTEEPSPEPSPSPSKPEPQPTLEPEPTPSPSATPTPTATETAKPVETPKPSPTPEPKPTETEEPSPEKTIEIKEEVSSENIVKAIAEVVKIEEPRNLSSVQQAAIKTAALETFETAEQGSEEYEAALDALAVLAEADDPELPEELAAIPLLGEAAGAILETFNDIGNAGADMSPEVREESEKVVVAAVIVSQVATTAATTAATAAAAAASASVGGGGGGSGPRRVK